MAHFCYVAHTDGAPSGSTYGAPPSSFGGGCHGRRRSSIPSPVKPLHRRPKLPSTARARHRRHRRHHVEHGAPPPSTATNDAHEDAVADRPKPTTVGPSLPRSKPFITTETVSTFQIRRGRKPTLITVAIRGESSSPVINKFNSIPLRSPGSVDPGRSSSLPSPPRLHADVVSARRCQPPPPELLTFHRPCCPLPDAPYRLIATIRLLPAPSINGHDCLARVGSKAPPA
ncbi:hypothetical protein ACLOJK_024483 [Asimina triloba]